MSKAKEASAPRTGKPRDANKTRRRRSTENVRHLIIEAAREVFAERGYDGATTREIARRAQTTTVMLFRHFGSKEQLFQQAVFEPFEQYLQSRIQQIVYSPLRPTGYTAVSEYVGGMSRLVSENRELLLALLAGHAFSLLNAPVSNGNALQDYLQHSESSLHEMNIDLGIDVDLGVRFGFALVLAVNLFEDRLFNDDHSEKERTRRLDNLTRFICGGLQGLGDTNGGSLTNPSNSE